MAEVNIIRHICSAIKSSIKQILTSLLFSTKSLLSPVPQTCTDVRIALASEFAASMFSDPINDHSTLYLEQSVPHNEKCMPHATYEKR